jgi:hypothetical protein
MHVLRILLSFAGIAAASLAAPVPETISAASYSVTLRLPESTWAVDVFDKPESIRYSHVWEHPAGEFFRITVVRVTLPSEKIDLDPLKLVSTLVQDDGLRFKQNEYGRGFHFTFKPEIFACPAGTAYVYSSDSAVFKDPHPHFAAVGLLLPNDYRVRKIGYLAVGHQLGGGLDVTQLQVKYLFEILKGLREKANQALEPTRGAVTPRAPESSSK